MIIYISESTLPGKKWMAQAEGQRTVHFGQCGASDFTIHRDEALRQANIARHGSKENWGRTGVMTPVGCPVISCRRSAASAPPQPRHRPCARTCASGLLRLAWQGIVCYFP